MAADKTPYYISRTIQTDGFLTSLVSEYAVPSDFDLIVCHMSAIIEAGLGQTGDWNILSINYPEVGGNYVNIDYDRPNTPVRYSKLSSMGAAIHVPSNCRLRATANFNAAVTRNYVWLSFSGYLIHPLSLAYI